ARDRSETDVADATLRGPGRGACRLALLARHRPLTRRTGADRPSARTCIGSVWHRRARQLVRHRYRKRAKEVIPYNQSGATAGSGEGGEPHFRGNRVRPLFAFSRLFSGILELTEVFSYEHAAYRRRLDRGLRRARARRSVGSRVARPDGDEVSGRGAEVLQARHAAADDSRDRRVLPRAAHGVHRVLRRRRAGAGTEAGVERGDRGARRRARGRDDSVREPGSAAQGRGERGAAADRALRGEGVQVPSAVSGVLPGRSGGVSALRGDRRAPAAGAVSYGPPGDGDGPEIGRAHV